MDEAVFSEATREMVEEGDWITPHYNRENRYDKPIFFYWLMGISYQVFGVSEFSARFVSATLATALVLLIFFSLRMLNGRMSHLSLLTPLILATSLEVILLARSAITDITLTFFITLSLLAFFSAYRCGRPELKTAWYMVFYAAMGFAVLTKGPIGLVLPAGILFFFLLSVGRLGQVLRECRWVPGIWVFSAVALPWYILEFQANGMEFFDAFFVKHNFTRYTGVISGHRGPFYYFIPVILVGFFPWSAFLPWAVGRILRPSLFRSFREKPPEEQLPLFAGIWFLVVFLFFSLSGTKLPGYILPLFPAMAILVGWWWTEGGDRKKIGVVTLAGIGTVLTAAFLYLPSAVPKMKLPDTLETAALGEIGNALWLLSLVIVVGLTAFFLCWWKGIMGNGVSVLVLMMAGFLLVTVHQALPSVDHALQSPLREIAQEAGHRIRSEGGQLIVYGINKPSILFYSRQYPTVLSRMDFLLLDHIFRSGEPGYLITTRNKLGQLPPLPVLIDRGGYVLLKLPKGDL